MPTATAEKADLAKTNKEFAAVVGCHHSMASRIRAGVRVPGADLADRIGKAYGIPEKTVKSTLAQGSEAFGELVRKRCFVKSAPATPAKSAAKSTKKATKK